MTNTIPARDEDEAPGALCGVCLHSESDHTEHEEEDAGDTVRRGYCNECEDWHDFVAAPES